MARQTVTTPLDHSAIADGIGELKEGKGYDRLIVGGVTLVYMKKTSLAVPAALVAKAPKRLGTFKPEKSGPWANVAVDSAAKARAIVEYVAAQKASQS